MNLSLSRVIELIRTEYIDVDINIHIISWLYKERPKSNINTKAKDAGIYVDEAFMYSFSTIVYEAMICICASRNMRIAKEVFHGFRQRI